MIEHTVESENLDRPAGELKQAACLECRRSKIKCLRAPDAEACKKCTASGIECVVPSYHVGRYKGIKNKRSGLEKAIHHVEEAVKRARTSGTGLPDQHAEALQRLLEKTRPIVSEQARDQIRDTKSDNAPRISTAPEVDNISFQQPAAETNQDHSHSRQPSLRIAEEADELTINNAGNPLELLAIASAIPEDLTTASPSTIAKVSPVNLGSSGRVQSMISDDDDQTQLFFSPTTTRLDLGPEIDPIELGLITQHEAQKLFNHFHQHLSHTRWGLDRVIHSPEFVRSRSAFLFTSILAGTALFLADASALSVRLQNHCKTLALRASSGDFRSLEIVLAFMINVPWSQPGKTWSVGDRSCYFLSQAMTMAIDLSLNKIVIPSTIIRPSGAMDKIAPSECINAQRALKLDGHNEVDPSSELGRRLLRIRERVWIALFTLDRGVCLARGRTWTVPAGPLIDTCETWHVSDVADQEDGSLVATCVLRRDFGGLISSIRSTCDNNHFTSGSGPGMVKYMREKVEGFFTNWSNTWTFQICQQGGKVPPYVEILVSHGKLSAYCSVINHPTAAMEIKQFFRAAGLTAALDVIRVVIENEAKLQSLPNNSVIMVSFAACFILGLSTTRRNGRSYIAPQIKRSVLEAAAVLDRLGSVTQHRHGASKLFGQHIRRIIQQHSLPVDEVESEQNTLGNETNGSMHHTFIRSAPFMLQPASQPGILQDYSGFDSMSEDQLLAAIVNAKDDIENFHAEFQTEDSLFMNWLDWPV